MKLSKHENNKIKFFELTFNELIGLLKLQVPIEVHLLTEEKLIIERKDDYGIFYLKNGRKYEFEDFMVKLRADGLKYILISIADFKTAEPLIINLDKTDKKKIGSASHINYWDNIFNITYKPESNGASNKVFYFEENNTFLFFDKNGPNLKTETKTSTFLDLIGK